MIRIKISCCTIDQQNKVMRMLSPLLKNAKVKHKCTDKFLQTHLSIKDGYSE